ncbi:hypothetical protein FB451DRAFT_1372117 [Mycena latifolia]|nr:hypothetical protein FB451DRAFT_1372117 [Mycena latifolia]
MIKGLCPARFRDYTTAAVLRLGSRHPSPLLWHPQASNTLGTTPSRAEALGAQCESGWLRGGLGRCNCKVPEYGLGCGGGFQGGLGGWPWNGLGRVYGPLQSVGWGERMEIVTLGLGHLYIMPSAKRPRTELETSEVALTRSSIWYSDGSVVLQAEATQFRVHASILSAGSTVFRDMFEVAQAPINPDSQVDGCPLVHLYDDNALEVEIVLEALYDRSFYKVDQKTFVQVAVMWRLGRKYGFDELRDDAVRRLEQTYPSTLPEYQARYFPISVMPPVVISPYPGIHFDAINLARATGLDSILPAALYLVCSERENQRRIHEYILSSQPGADGKECSQPSCRPAPEFVCVNLATPIPQLIALHPEILEPEDSEERICANCKVDRQSWFAGGQRDFWNALPSIFKLPYWDNIRKEGAL